MSLLWVDSLHYAHLNHMQAVYGLSISGITVGAPHTAPHRTSVQVTFGNFAVPATNPLQGPGEDVCLIGFRIGLGAAPPTRTEFAQILAPNLSAQLRLFLVPVGSKQRIEVWSGDSRRVILRSSLMDLVSRMRFVELEARISSQGRCQLRIDGVQDTFNSSVNTASVVGSIWHSVQFNVSAAGGSLRFADLYVADAVGETQFLGPQTVQRIFPWEQAAPKDAWAITRRRRLVVMMGQSNMNGYRQSVALAPYTGEGRNPNSAVSIWNVENQAFESIQAHVNTGSQFYAGQAQYGELWGPEMAFAERIASWMEKAGYAFSEVYIVKMAEDASWVAPNSVIPGVPTWNPNSPGNLLTTAITQINNAVASLGGWGFIEPQIDVFWHQGESEALLGQQATPFYLTWTNQVFDHFEAQIPATVNWHRTIMHPDTLPVVFTGTQQVVNMQRLGGLRGTVTETFDIPLVGVDKIHYTQRGFDTLGNRYYQRWVERVASRDQFYLLDDFLFNLEFNNVGIEILDTETDPAFFSTNKSMGHDLLHLPSRISLKSLARSTLTDASLEASLGGSSIPAAYIPSSPSFDFNLALDTKFVSAEVALGTISLKIHP